MKLLGKDETGRRYHWLQYKAGCIGSVPWETELFDIGLFVSPSAPNDDVEASIREFLGYNCEWVSVFGRASEYWHDRVDQISVEMGRQKQVGDGNPMTAWFEEVTALEDLDASQFFGIHAVLILLVGFTDEEARRIERSGEKLGT